MLNEDLFIWRGCDCLLPSLGNTKAAADEHEENADNSKDHEDYQSSMAKLYQQENVIFIAWSKNIGLNISHLYKSEAQRSETTTWYTYVCIRLKRTCNHYGSGIKATTTTLNKHESSRSCRASLNKIVTWSR